MSVILKDDPHAIANRIIWLMNDVDETKPCNLIMNADALVVEYNCRFTGYKIFHEVGHMKKIS